MKKLFALILALLMVFSMVACAAKEETAKVDAPAADAPAADFCHASPHPALLDRCQRPLRPHLGVTPPIWHPAAGFFGNPAAFFHVRRKRTSVFTKSTIKKQRKFVAFLPLIFAEKTSILVYDAQSA